VQLLDSPRASTLVRLELGIASDAKPHAVDPPKKTRAPRLTELVLEGGHAGDDWLRAIAAADMPVLHTLRIWDAGVTDAGLVALAGSPMLASVRALTMHGDFGDDAVEALCASPHLQLDTLNLSGNCITDRGARAIAESKGLRGLLSLLLRKSRITDAGVESLFASFERSTLRTLELGDNPIENRARLHALFLLCEARRHDLPHSGRPGDECDWDEGIGTPW
jgi:hypothetical protein